MNNLFTLAALAVALLFSVSPANATLVQVVADTGDSRVVDTKSSGIAYAENSSGTRFTWGEADASSGTLKAYAICAEQWASASTTTLIQDTFTYYGPNTTLVMAMHVDGIYTADLNAKIKASAYIGYGINGSGEVGGWVSGPVSGSIDTTLYGYRWTTNGETFGLQYGLDAAAAYIAASNFGSTATVNFMALDGAGSPVSLADEAYLVSQEGFDSRRGTSSVPEPATVLLLGLTIVGFAGGSVRRRFL